jgi:hypothetical protein
MLRGVLAMGLWTAVFVVAACAESDPDADCATYCEIRSGCCATSPELCRDNDDIPSCTSTCRALAKDDEDYAAAIEDKARCFEEADDDCSEILGGCQPDGT